MAEMRTVSFERDWGLNVSIPNEILPQFQQSVLLGAVTMEANSPYRNLLLCAQPKSASLYLAQLITFVFDIKYFQIGFNFKGGCYITPVCWPANFTQGIPFPIAIHLQPWTTS